MEMMEMGPLMTIFTKQKHTVCTVRITRLPQRRFHTKYLQARSFHAVLHDYTPGTELRQLESVVPKLEGIRGCRNINIARQCADAR